MLDATVGYPTTTDTAEAAVAPDAPPAQAILEVEVLDAQTTRYGDIVVKTSKDDPMFAMARRLIKEGHDAETLVQFVWMRDGSLSFRGTLASLAQWTVEENDNGIRLRRYRPSRLWGVAGKESREALPST